MMQTKPLCYLLRSLFDHLIGTRFSLRDLTELLLNIHPTFYNPYGNMRSFHHIRTNALETL